MAAHRVTRLLLVACRERNPQGAVPLCLRHGSEKHVEWFPGLPEGFATIRSSNRSLSKRQKNPTPFGTSCAIPAPELRWLLRETIVGSERQCSARGAQPPSEEGGQTRLQTVSPCRAPSPGQKRYCSIGCARSQTASSVITTLELFEHHLRRWVIG
jgi:hypothetical protein